MSAPVTITIAGTTATTTMPRPAVGQPMSGEEAAAQDALNLLRNHGFTLAYDHAPLGRLTPLGTLTHWIGQQPGPVTTWDCTKAMGWDFWMTEALLEQGYQLGRVGFTAGAGWHPLRRTSDAAQAPEINPNQLALQLPTAVGA
jgi:hypothetical protein